MTEPPSPFGFGKPFLLHPFDLLRTSLVCGSSRQTAMRVRVLHAKLYASATICFGVFPAHYSYMHMRCQARQLDSYSTARHCSTARQLDRTRQTSTDLDTPAHAVSLDLPRRDRQLLDSYSTGSTGKALTGPRQRPRQRLDGASTARTTARQPGLNSLYSYGYLRGNLTAVSTVLNATRPRTAPPCPSARRARTCPSNTWPNRTLGLGL